MSSYVNKRIFFSDLICRITTANEETVLLNKRDIVDKSTALRK